MGKRLAIAAAIAVAVVLAGALLSRGLFERGETDDAPERAAPEVDPAAAPVGQPPAIDAASPERIAVLSREGTVERRAPDGSWREVDLGEELSERDLLRTGADGRLTLQVGDTAEVTVDPRSQISVPALTATVSRLQLGEGRLAARVPGDSGRTFGVEIEGTGTVAETEDGAFAVLTGGDETAVATTAGSVRVTAEEQTVSLAAGEQSLVRRGGPPGPPQAIPPSLFLKVERPGAVQRTSEVTVRGSTAPGAILRVNGVPVQVREDGRFTTVIALAEGRNRVEVESRDAAGRSRDAEVQVVVDTRGPSVGGKVRWGGDH
jgi:hypothetical protein